MGGELTVRIDPSTDLEVSLGTGALSISDMDGWVDAEVGRAEIDVEGHGAGPVAVVADGGAVDLTFDAHPSSASVDLQSGALQLKVPSGSYALDLEAIGGIVTLDPDVVEDPSSDRTLSARVGGDITVTAGR